MAWTSLAPLLYIGQPVEGMQVLIHMLLLPCVLCVFPLTDCAQALLRVHNVEFNVQVGCCIIL